MSKSLVVVNAWMEMLVRLLTLFFPYASTTTFVGSYASAPFQTTALLNGSCNK